jgi:hypothetical protein
VERGYEDKSKKIEESLFVLAISMTVIMHMTVTPWLRAENVPEILTGLFTGAAVPSLVFFGGRRWFQKKVLPRLPDNLPMYIDGDWLMLARMVRGGLRTPESEGTARITQNGDHAELEASTTFSMRVTSLYMAMRGKTHGILVYEGKRRNCDSILHPDIFGIADFHFIYPGGNSTVAPIGIYFLCRENRPGALEGGDLVEVVYFRPGMQEEVLRAVAWNPSLMLLAA